MRNGWMVIAAACAAWNSPPPPLDKTGTSPPELRAGHEKAQEFLGHRGIGSFATERKGFSAGERWRQTRTYDSL